MMSSVLLVLSLFCHRLSISTKPYVAKEVESNVAHGLATKSIHHSIQRSAAIPPASPPDCDWVILEGDLQFRESIGVCWDLSGISIRFDYDSNTNQVIFKQFEDEECHGDYTNAFEPETPYQTNLNTGFLCETYAFSLPVFRTAFDGTGTTQPFTAQENWGNGQPNNCNAFLGDTFYQILECDATTPFIRWRYYEDDQCETLIPPDSYFPIFFNSPDSNQCHKFNYTETFTVGDIAFMVEEMILYALKEDHMMLMVEEMMMMMMIVIVAVIVIVEV